MGCCFVVVVVGLLLFAGGCCWNETFEHIISIRAYEFADYFNLCLSLSDSRDFYDLEDSNRRICWVVVSQEKQLPQLCYGILYPVLCTFYFYYSILLNIPHTDHTYIIIKY